MQQNKILRVVCGIHGGAPMSLGASFDPQDVNKED